MNPLKHIRILFKNIANAAKQRQQQLAFDKLEAERLDRIRHPEKYRGK